MERKEILVVEDDPALRRVLAEFLGELGYGVVDLDDAASALVELRRQHPDVILLDLIMPKAELDGVGFLSEIAGSPAATVPIIVISGLGEPLAQEVPPEVSTALRITRILTKPVPLETLAREIDQLVGPGVQ